MRKKNYIKGLKHVIEIICIPFGQVRNCIDLAIQRKNFTIFFRRICSLFTTRQDGRGMRYGIIDRESIIQKVLIITTGEFM